MPVPWVVISRASRLARVPDHPSHRLGPLGVVGQKLAIGDAPLGVLGPLARLHQAKENAAAEVLVRLGELLQGLVGPVLQGTFDTPQLGVGPEREPADVAALPQLVESELEQRQGPGLAFDVGQEPLGQARLQLAADLERRQLDRRAELVLAHRPNLDQVGVEHVVEPLERGAGAQKVRPHRQDDGHPPPGAAAACSRLAKNASRPFANASFFFSSSGR